ncbi:retrovirus-related Pol polyprotein from transposon TNT 1-94 [Trichonephila clavipes]|nr:retrovirus-related Pol polyprotein from transposon TNT 1-94 [Trichonephila clavipes]
MNYVASTLNRVADMEFNNQISVLTQNNWNTWKHDMQVLLMHYGCWQFIIQTKPEQPDEEATYKEKLDLQLRKDRCYTLIYTNISSDLKNLITETTDGVATWKILKDHFEPVTKARVIQLLDQFFGTKYQPGEDVGIFISRVKTAATRLQEAGHKLDDLYIGFQLIRWLPQEFQSTVQQIYRWKEEDFRVVKIEAELILEANSLQLMKQDLEKAENAYLSSFTSKKSKTLPGATAAAHGDPNGKNDYQKKSGKTINVRFDENKRGINFRQKVNSNLGYNLNLPDYYDDEDDFDRVKDSLTSRLVSKTSTEMPSTSEEPDVSSDNHSLIPCTEVKSIRNIGRKLTGSNVYYSIEGEATRLKSFNEIERYCKRHNIEYDPSLFNFRKDNTKSQGFSDLSEQQEALMVEVTIPNCYKQAIRSRDASKWHDVMDKEINVMKELKVWDLVDHPDNIKILENRWVYTIKYDENNKIVRYKARLVARDTVIYMKQPTGYEIDNNKVYSDFATNRDDRVSMGGFITFIDETPISWRTFKQKSVSLSTMEAEYVSLTEAAKEFIWLKNVIDNKSLNLELSENVMFCDNQAAISFSKSPVENYRTKHIDVRYHFLRNLIYDKENEPKKRRSNLELYKSYKESDIVNSIKIQRIKWTGETYIQFAARLTANFQYYCSLRKVNSFELCDLIISDKLFETLNKKETATHIGIREAEDWFRPIDLLKSVIFIFHLEADHIKKFLLLMDIPKTPSFLNQRLKRTIPKYLERENKNCFICGDSSHYTRDCEKRFKLKESNDHIHNRINVNTLKIESEKQNSDECANLQYVNIFVENQPVTALIDSGCQIPVLNSSLIRVQTPSEEIITLSCMFWRTAFSSGLHGSTAADSVRSYGIVFARRRSELKLKLELVEEKQKLLDIRAELESEKRTREVREQAFYLLNIIVKLICKTTTFLINFC